MITSNPGSSVNMAYDGQAGAASYNAMLNQMQQHNYEYQVSDRVRDALRAGINPLAALGMSSGYQPQFQQVNQTGGKSSPLEGLFNLAGAASSIASAVGAVMNVKDMVDMKDLTMESAKLQNDYTRAQINHLINQNPGVSGASFGNRAGGMKAVINGQYPEWIEGEGPGSQIVHTAGGDMYVPSSQVADALDVEFSGGNPYAWEYAIRDYGGRLNNWVNQTLPGRAYNWLKRKVENTRFGRYANEYKTLYGGF